MAYDDKNVTTLALEVPKGCLIGTGNGVIGGWTTASLPQASMLSAAPKSGLQTTAVTGGAWVQGTRVLQGHTLSIEGLAFFPR